MPVFSAVITLAVVELGLTLFHPIQFSMERNMYFEPDPFTGYKLKPNATGFFQQNISATANLNGHRDEYVPVNKPDGTFRILVIGDSFTVGANVEQVEAYSEVLEALLNENAVSKVEVINTGVGGWQPFQYAQYYEHYGWKYSPDLILVGFFVGNDTYDQINRIEQLQTAIMGRRVSRKAAASRFIRFKMFLYNHFNLARIILYKGPVSGDFTRNNCSDFTDQYIEIQRHKLDNHQPRTIAHDAQAANAITQIKRIQTRAEQHSIPLIVVIIPDENQINHELQMNLLTEENEKNFDAGMPQAMLQELFRTASVQIIDLLPYFNADPRCLYMNDTHWTPEGHALAAEVLFNHISKEFLLKH